MQADLLPAPTFPEIWGGIECTINRVGDRYFDQLRYANHYKREGDLEQIVQLGIKKIRYPVLWEKHQPVAGGTIDWSWTAKQLQYLEAAGVTVIAGLVHHGSGPSYTHLLDPAFPKLLADYALQVARRFPHLRYFTPVNEPLTTARFSGLYRLWYPHKSSDLDCMRMVLHECKATVLAMAAIRSVIPEAQLVQTEDLGKIYSTPLLQYQADFENERRWLSYDLLCGRVHKGHSLWPFLMAIGITPGELQFFIDQPCVPDIFGFNHYVTSERYLDERTERYPPHTRGGNGRHRYADVEAVRVVHDAPSGIKVLLQEAWQRYGRPMAVTEVHLHCTREEQLRWFKYVWEACCELRQDGVQLEAVTAWALLGSVGWNKLLTKPRGVYEPGVFDLRGGALRPTALAQYIRQITTGDTDHMLTGELGWWQRSTRYLHQGTTKVLQTEGFAHNRARPLLIVGKTGVLGKAFAHGCYSRAIPFVLLGREECDITSPASVAQVLKALQPWAVINAAGYARIDEAEIEIDRCFLENEQGAMVLANACAQQGIRLLTFSSDQVFDGCKNKPYLETDPVNPLNVYGRSKVAAETAVLQACPGALVVRTAALFSAQDSFNFLHGVVDSLSRQSQITVAEDVTVSPTYVPDLVQVSLDLLIDAERGIWHLANKGAVSWADLAFETARMLRLNNMFINAQPYAAMGMEAPRPSYSVLGSDKGLLMPTLEDALRRFVKEQKYQVRVGSIV